MIPKSSDHNVCYLTEFEDFCYNLRAPVRQFCRHFCEKAHVKGQMFRGGLTPHAQ